jgi:hypothetical protein
MWIKFRDSRGQDMRGGMAQKRKGILHKNAIKSGYTITCEKMHRQAKMCTKIPGHAGEVLL